MTQIPLTFQEKPFEEVLAEQQQFADSLLKGEKSNKDKEKKSKKQVVKKNKEKEKGKSHGSAAPTPQAVAFGEKLHVEFEPDAEVIPEEPLAIHVEKEKKKSEKKDKVMFFIYFSEKVHVINTRITTLVILFRSNRYWETVIKFQLRHLIRM